MRVVASVAIAAIAFLALPAYAWVVVEVKQPGSQTTGYFAMLPQDPETPLEVQRFSSEITQYRAALDSFQAGFCKFTTGDVEFQVDRRPGRMVDFEIEVFEGSFSLTPPMIEELRSGETLFVNLEKLAGCVREGAPLRLTYPLAGFDRAFAELNRKEFVVGHATIAVDDDGVSWRSAGSGYEAVLKIASQRTASGYSSRITGQSTGCRADDVRHRLVSLQVDQGPVMERKADLSAPVYRTGYYGGADFFVDEDTLASMKSGEWLAIRICADEGEANLKFDLGDFNRAWTVSRSMHNNR